MKTFQILIIKMLIRFSLTLIIKTITLIINNLIKQELIILMDYNNNRIYNGKWTKINLILMLSNKTLLKKVHKILEPQMFIRCNSWGNWMARAHQAPRLKMNRAPNS
jgi:hypothetical protein